MDQQLTSAALPETEEMITLEQILPNHHFLLVDNCMIHPDYTLAEDLYTTRYPNQLARFEARLEALITISESYRSYISLHSNMYMTPEVKEEIQPLIRHLHQVASHHEMMVSRLEKDLRYKKKRPPYSRCNKSRNKFLEARHHDKVEDDDEIESTPRSIQLLHTLIDSLQSLQEEFPLYRREQQLPQITIAKASPADASMVAALFDYVQKLENQERQAAILTADGDLIKLYHSHFATLTPSKQVELPQRTAVYFREPHKETFLRFVYRPPSKVRETLTKEKKPGV